MMIGTVQAAHLAAMGALETLRDEHQGIALNLLQANQQDLAREAILRSEGVRDAIHELVKANKRWKEDND